MIQALVKRQKAVSPDVTASSGSQENSDANKNRRSIPEGPTQGTAMKFRFGNGDQPLNGFTIKRGVGVGGFGEVYFATNDAGKEVALKQIQRNLDVEVRGVRQCMNLKHPNLISLFDIRFDDENQGWIVMEYVSGHSLRDAIEAHPTGLPNDELMRWFGQISAGVAYLHDHGIVHRDLKPANIFEDEGIVKIGDYGLSKFISCSRRGGQTESVGTFHYMAPEIGKGEYGKEIDVYALGIMLYELCTGNVPFDGESSQEIIMKHLTADPDLTAVPPAMREVISRALAKSPTQRYSDVREMVRPLGMEVDDRYLLVRNNGGAAAVPPVVNPASPKAAQVREKAKRHFAAAVSPSSYRNPPKAQRSPAGSYAAEEPPITSLKYDEPIARNLRDGWKGLNRWWNDLSMNPGMKTAILILAIIFCVFNAGTFVSIIVVGLLLYIPYYAVWWLMRSPKTPSARSRPNYVRNTQPQPKPEPPPRPRPVPANRPMSVRQWRTAKRFQLKSLKRGSVWGEVTGSWLGSAAVIAVFGAMVALFQIGSGHQPQSMVIGMIWASVIALTMACISIGFGKRWQNEEGDWAIRSFTQLTSGFLIGAFAFGLAQFLMVPWESITQESIGDLPVKRWSGFFDASGQPLLPAYLAYFPLMMGMIHWWKQVDPLRRTRFSFWAVIWSVIAASLVHLLIPFPQPWGQVIAAGTSIAIQLSSPWINPTERLNVKQSVA